jgi:hypothetical protein
MALSTTFGRLWKVWLEARMEIASFVARTALMRRRLAIPVEFLAKHFEQYG